MRRLEAHLARVFRIGIRGQPQHRNIGVQKVRQIRLRFAFEVRRRSFDERGDDVHVVGREFRRCT